jgi:RHH-type rel operon transcriptional repressor/antitoxin RelB
MTMGTLNIRIDDDLKARSYAVLEKLGITPSELLRQTLEYVVSQERLPFRTTVVTEDEEALLALVRERLASPQKGIKVSLDDL